MKAIWGGVYTELLNFGGGLDGIGQKWGGSASGARRAPNWYTPPPGMFMTHSLTQNTSLPFSINQLVLFQLQLVAWDNLSPHFFLNFLSTTAPPLVFSRFQFSPAHPFLAFIFFKTISLSIFLYFFIVFCVYFVLSHTHKRTSSLLGLYCCLQNLVNYFAKFALFNLFRSNSLV